MLQTHSDIQADPTCIPLLAVDPTEINGYLNEGELLFSQGLMDEAQAMFLKVTLLYPGSAPAWNNMAVIASLEGQDADAEKFFRQALEVQEDYLDAAHNLAELYVRQGNFKRAARELNRVLEFKPSDIPTLKFLSRIYIDMGQPEKGYKLLEEFKGMGAMRGFIDSLWLGIKYYTMADDLSHRDKLEKLTSAILKYLDGQDGRSPRYKLVSTDQETGEEVVLEDFHSMFYYRENPSLTATGEPGADSMPVVLTISDHADWHFFREALRAEMRSEGGCLGDFTQARKVMKREPQLAPYDLEATLKYFRANVGPCDCHALKGSMV